MKCIADITEFEQKRGVGRIIYVVSAAVLKRFAQNLSLQETGLAWPAGTISPINFAQQARMHTSQARLARLLSEYDDLLALAAMVSFQKEVKTQVLRREV